LNIYEYSRASVQHSERCEDATLVFSTNGKASVFAVIDGMGGHRHLSENGQMMTGQDAAQMIRTVLVEDLEHLPADVSADPGGSAENSLIAAIVRAHQRVYFDLNGGDAQNVRNRIGAVMTAVAVCENAGRLLAVQVGDSRAYLYSHGELIQLCVDEDNIEFSVRNGIINEDDADRVSAIINNYDGVNDPQPEGQIMINGQFYDLYMAWHWFVAGNAALNILPSNVVINSLGTSRENPIAETSRIEVEDGDILLLCTDGLYKNLSEKEILDGLHSPGDPARRLGEMAYVRSQDDGNRRRNPDDISVIVVRF
jgi:serine/threonine protein phosphatase PrpC